jgi:hypothetical protein
LMGRTFFLYFAPYDSFASLRPTKEPFPIYSPMAFITWVGLADSNAATAPPKGQSVG